MTRTTPTHPASAGFFIAQILGTRTGVKMARGWAGRVATRRVCVAREVGESAREGHNAQGRNQFFEERFLGLTKELLV